MNKNQKNLFPLQQSALPESVTKRFQGDAQHMSRVRGKIQRAILDFVASVGVGNTFSMNELTEYVMAEVQIAPDSAGRILRALRREGSLSYKVVSRRESKYEVVA